MSEEIYGQEGAEDLQQGQAPDSGEMEALRAELDAIKLGARPDCAKDVVTLAGTTGKATRESIGGVLARYPQFKNAPLPGAPNPPGAAEPVDAFLTGFRR